MNNCYLFFGGGKTFKFDKIPNDGFLYKYKK